MTALEQMERGHWPEISRSIRTSGPHVPLEPAYANLLGDTEEDSQKIRARLCPNQSRTELILLLLESSVYSQEDVHLDVWFTSTLTRVVDAPVPLICYCTTINHL